MKRHFEDSAYKLLFENNDMVRSLLQNFVHEDWVDSLDLDDYEIRNVELKSIFDVDRSVDKLYEFHSRDHSFALLLLVEFQGRPVPMYLRIRDYETRIWDSQIRKKQKAMVVVPVVVYTGATPWKESPKAVDFVHVPKTELERFLMGDYILLEVNKFEIEQLLNPPTELGSVFALGKVDFKKNPNVALVQYTKIFQEIKRKNLKNFNLISEYFTGLLIQKGVQLNIIEDVIYNPMEGNPMTLFEQSLNELFDERDRIATENGLSKGYAKGMKQGIEDGIAKGMKQGIEDGIAKGMKQGIEDGIAKGMEQGIEQERIKNAAAMKANGLDYLLISKITQLSLDTIKTL